MKWIVRVNTRNGKIIKQEASPEEMRWGGRLLISKFLLREVPPTCDPLGRFNKFIVAPGLLGDTSVTTTGKFSVGGKSPLTHGVKESDVGGEAGKKIARLGIKAIVLEDIPEKPHTHILTIKVDDITLSEYPELKGKFVTETFQILRKRFGPQVGIICIGPAGEMKMLSAGVAVTDIQDIQVRYAARGGLGAVMGSKGIKAIVIDDTNASPLPAFDEALLRETSKNFVQAILEDPKTENRHKYGTPAILMVANELGLLPTRNFSAGQFEKAEAIAGEHVAEVIAERKGEGRSGTPCVRGCVIQCCNIFPDPSGKKTVASIQYENIALLGSNCGIGDLDDIAELNRLCNEVGVDAIETGAAIGVAMEAGVIPFGDAKGAKDLIHQIGRGTYLGRIIGNGVVVTGKVLGIRRVPAIKGQAIPGYDPRALKGNGVTYITSPMGADHTAGNAFETAKTINPIGKENQVENSRKLQIRAAILDTMGLCLFTRPPFVKKPELFALFLKGRYGWDVTHEEVQKIGIDALETEREFNRRAGVSEEFFDIPEFMRGEPLPPRNSVYDISMEEMKRIWDVKLPIDIF
ncbi:MAG: aldehyde ferredoxin oxidoreductase C-terminal domain-containing protein [Thermodesulfobacteriota bacterium]|nr:aldehyde ferredoxin oxidoreductase C-terminal domain-containing protein [Thermodesulfobacteriota bacterium]